MLFSDNNNKKTRENKHKNLIYLWKKSGKEKNKQSGRQAGKIAHDVNYRLNPLFLRFFNF